MPEMNNAESANLDAELADQVFEEGRQSETETEEGKKDEAKDNVDASEQTESSEDGKETEATEDATETEVEQTEETGQQTKVKLGNREFDTTEEALSEASRVIGHNANLASEVTNMKSTVDSLTAKLNEAVEANKKWAEWASANEEGPTVEKPNQPKIEDIVQKVLEERERRESTRTLEQQMKSEVDKLQSLSNFDAAFPLLKELAARLNPSTGKVFTPFEAYEYSCWKLGLKNEMAGGEPAKPVSPTAGATQAIKRPVASPKSAPAKENEKADEVSEMLSQYM